MGLKKQLMARVLILLFVLTLLSCEDTSPPPALRDAVQSPLIRFDKRSEFNRILVVDEGEMRHLRFGAEDCGNQSTISLSNPGEVPMEYIRFTMLGMLLTPQQERVLMIGLGGGTFTTLLRRHYPTLWIDAVEIDPVVVEAAKGFFAVQEDSRFRIHIEDGAAFIERTQHSYDLIVLDAYTGDGIPEHLVTPKLFNAVKAKLSSSGVAVFNLWDERPKEHLVEKLFRTTFPETACIRSADGFNLILFGKASATIPEHTDLVTAARQLTSDLGLSFDLGKVAEKLSMECPRS
jgi:spermidine synthase